MGQYQVGLIGLAVMGANLARNIRQHGFSIAVYNRTTERTREYLAGPASGSGIAGANTVEEFVSSLERPRRIILMVQAGKPVDAVIDQLVPLLEPGDVVMDGGNSFYRDTDRRSAVLSEHGLNFFGTGISGGEEGALHGPSIMPGGPRDGYEQYLAPVLTAIAAQVADGPCCTYLGPRGAGHYVKMVHNGIEYGDMQLIAEAYALLSRGLGIPAPELSAIFREWNRGELDSYLIEITAKVLAFTDPDTGTPLVDLILDQAGQKGTGRWTSQDALDLGVPIPTIDAAVWSRNISAFKAERVAAAKVIGGGDGKVSVPPFTPRRSPPMPRAWLYCARRRRSTASASIWQRWRASGRAAASSAPGSSTTFKAPSSGTRSCRTSSSMTDSATCCSAIKTPGDWRWGPPWERASRRPPPALRSPTSIATGAHVCRPT
jgi:6-phosphogluconate dehydrogenase